MITSRRARVVAIGILLMLQLGLMIWYGSLEPAPQVWDLPGSNAVTTEYEQWVGHRVAISGQIVTTKPPRVELSGYDMRLRLVGLTTDVERGDRLRAYGILKQGKQLRVQNGYTVPQSNLWYVYLVSFGAGVWVLARVIAGWELDLETLTVRKRGDEPGWKDRLP